MPKKTPEQITFTFAEIVDLVIALDLARDAAFLDIREATVKRSAPQHNSIALTQLTRWTELTKKLEQVIAT